MKTSRRELLTLDANVFVAAVRANEPFTDECQQILRRVADEFTLIEPSIVYVEVFGTLARRVGSELAEKARLELGSVLDSHVTVTCDREFCLRAYPLCHLYGVYAVDSLYLEAAVEAGSILISLDNEDFIDRIKRSKPSIKAMHISEFIE
jgi:predicted nucleic acid-binding protein